MKTSGTPVCELEPFLESKDVGVLDDASTAVVMPTVGVRWYRSPVVAVALPRLCHERAIDGVHGVALLDWLWLKVVGIAGLLLGHAIDAGR